MKIYYRIHQENTGWTKPVSDGATAGTTGENLRLEAVEIALPKETENLNVEYQVQGQNYGWQEWKSNGALAGTEGQQLRIEAIRARLWGESADQYDILYRVHMQDVGWLDWAKNGTIAGSVGQSKRIEALQIVIVEKGQTPVPDPKSDFPGGYFPIPAVTCQGHVQDRGWMSARTGSEAGIVEVGTTGAGLRLECLKAVVRDKDMGITISGQAHVQNKGWCDAQDGSEGIGTTGENLRLEAIRLNKTGGFEGFFDLWYQVHVRNKGWMGWAKNGENAGTEGMSLQIEAIRVALLPTGVPAPGSTEGAYEKYVAPPAPGPSPAQPEQPADPSGWRAGICAAAGNEVGYEEENDWTKYGQWYEDNFNAPGFSRGEWCAMFCSWCARQAGIPESVLCSCAYVPAWVNWAAAQGKLMGAYGDYEPQAGDLVIFSWECSDDAGSADHVGLVVDFDGSNITTIEGNTGDGNPCVMVKSWPYTHDCVVHYISYC